VRRCIAFVVLLTLAVAVPAAAKEGAQAHLLTPLPGNAKAGALITVKWAVDVPGANGKRVPFVASGMFARLVGRNGTSTTATATQVHGPAYSVRIRVPRGGIRNVQVGLHGWALTPAGKHPAPLLFPIMNNPLHPRP
jgi:hypothetical protein